MLLLRSGHAGGRTAGAACLYSSNDSSLEIVSLALTKTCSWENKRRTATETEKSCVCSFVKLSHAHNNSSRQLIAPQPAAKQIWVYNWMIKLTWIRTTFKQPVRTAQKAQSVSVIKTSQLMLYRKIMAVCSETHTKHINTVCGQNVELLNVKLAVRIVTNGL